MKFTREQLEIFALISHDRNPLHCDDAYARRTHFGKTVFYGIGGVLSALGSWAQGRNFALESIKGVFKKPLFLDEEYDLEIVENDHKATLKLKRANQTRCEINFTWTEFKQESELSRSSVFSPLIKAASPDLLQGNIHFESIAYQPLVSRMASLSSSFGINSMQLPTHQLWALLGASYLIGMELPGQQALFSEFSFEFAPPSNSAFKFAPVTSSWDERFNLVQLSGRGEGISSFELNAYLRPPVTFYSSEEIKRLNGQSHVLEGKTVLVTGSSRGFGAVLAQMLGLHGAFVFVHGRTPGSETAQVADQIRSAGGRATAVHADLSSSVGCRELLEQVNAVTSAPIDLLITNAFSTIEPKRFLDQTHEEFMGFLRSSITMSSQLWQVLLPRMNPAGTIVSISTSFVTQPVPEYAHYIAAKSAVEGLVRALSREFKHLRFVIARPPRMLTDQTNTAYRPIEPASASTIGAKLIQDLLQLPIAPGVYELDGDRLN